MILTVCPNPSIDCTIELDNLNVGKLNIIRNKVETFSGKALNVAKGASRLNGDVTVTGFMFSSHARLFEQSLEAEGVKHGFIYCEGEARVNYKVIDNKSMLTEINGKGGLVTRDKQLALLEKVKELSKGVSVAVISGSLPEGVEPSFYGEIAGAIPDGVKLIVDTGKENMESALLSGKVFMVKPNLRELEDFSGRRIRSTKDVISAAKEYVDKGAKYALVSLGAEGALLTDGTKSVFCKSASVAVNSTVGAGDCMISAACVSIEENLGMRELLRRSVAAGTAAITTSGTNLFYKDKYDEIYAKLTVEDVG